MLIEAFAIPLLTLLLGIVSLAFDSSDNNRQRGLLLGLIVVAFLGICGFEIDANIKAEEEKQANAERIANDAERIANLDRRNDLLTEYLTRIETTANDTNASVVALLAQLSDQGYSLDTLEAVEQSLEADEVLQEEIEIKENSGEPELGPLPQVQYPAQDVDPTTVGVKLTELGFDAVPIETEQPEAITNSIFFSPDIAVEDVQLVALTLTRAGVQIRSIQPLSDPTDNTNLIQVSANAELGETCGVWSVKAIQSVTAFDTNNGGCAPISTEVAQRF